MQKYFAGELQPWQEKAYRAEDGIFYLVSDVEKMEAGREMKDYEEELDCTLGDPCDEDHTCWNHRILADIKHNHLADKEAAVKEITESRDEWKRQWILIEAAEKKAEEQIAALQGEISRLYAITVEQNKQIAALNDALSGRDGVIERLKGYLVNKKTDIAEKVEYIDSLTAENEVLREQNFAMNKSTVELRAEVKRLKERKEEDEKRT